MRFTRWVFLIAGIYGILVLVPGLFMEQQAGEASPPARLRPLLQPWLDRLLALPAVQRTWAAEGLAAPFI